MATRAHNALLVAALVAATSSAAQQPFDVDESFQVSILESGVGSVLPLENGQLIVSGRMVFVGDDIFTPRSGARLHGNGTRDTWFVGQGMGGRLSLWNNKVYCSNVEIVRRLHMNGAADQSFIDLNTGPYFSSLQRGDYHVYPDGRLLLTGTHGLNDVARGFVGDYNLIWFSNQGYLDTTRVHRRSNGIIWRIKQQPDGRFLCAGDCNVYEGQPVSPVFRVEEDGALDPSFNVPIQGIPTDIGSTFRYLLDLEPLADGGALIGGFWRLAGSTDTIGVMRVLPDGELDPSFTPVRLSTTYAPSPWLFPQVDDILPMPDGRMIITGNFDRLNGIPRGGIAMLNADGSVNSEHFAGAACGAFAPPNVQFPSRRIVGITPAPDGTYYIYGSYWGYTDGTTSSNTQRFVTRLHGNNVGIIERERITFTLYPNPASTQLIVQVEQLPAQGEWVLRDALGRVALRERVTSHQHTLGLHGLGSAVYMLELWSKGQRLASERVVVE